MKTNILDKIARREIPKEEREEMFKALRKLIREGADLESPELEERFKLSQYKRIPFPLD